MTVDDWDRGDAFALGVILNGDEIPSLTAHGEPVSDESFIVLFNAWREPVTFLLPPERFGRGWAHELSTVDPKRAANGAELAAGARGRGRRAGAVRAPARRWLSYPSRPA